MNARAAKSKSQVAYEWIKHRIATREFSPGYRLVLSTIAEELEMSVVPVREAIRQLEAEGVVTFTRNVGAQVSMVDISQYRESMETLSYLEGVATALSAPQLTPQDVKRARELNEEMMATLTDLDPYSFTVLNQKFHATLYKECPNSRLLELVDAEWVRLGYLRESSFTRIPSRTRESVEEHDHILTLIESSAPLEDIEKAARQHRLATLAAYFDTQQNLSIAGDTHD